MSDEANRPEELASTKTPLIQARGLQRHFDVGGDHVEVLRKLDLDVHAGETVALVGDSGCGKTTLLHLIAGFDRPDGGQIRVDGQDIGRLRDDALSRYRRERLGMVFQQFNLLSPLNVESNILFPLRLLGQEDQDWCDQLIRRLGLSSLLDRYPDQLSGGQQQRVAIARALAHRPSLLLADEPTGNLDEDNSEQVMQLLVDLVRESGATLVMVTHSRECAAWLDRRLRLEHGRISHG